MAGMERHEISPVVRRQCLRLTAREGIDRIPVEGGHVMNRTAVAAPNIAAVIHICAALESTPSRH
jgi:hypothetical protein